MSTLVVADVDGTLVDARGALFGGVSALVEAITRGSASIALASARPPRSLRALAAGLGSSVRVLSACQGALVETRDPDPDRLKEMSDWHLVRALSIQPLVVAALSAQLSERWAPWWYTADGWYVGRDDAAAQTEAEIIGFSWTAMEDGPPQAPVLKVLVVDDEAGDEVRAVVDALPGVQTVVSKPAYNEILSAEVSPDKGLDIIRASNPDVEQIIAIGDGVNDIGMLLAADVSYTFSDAPAEVREVATEVLAAPPERALDALTHKLMSGL